MDKKIEAEYLKSTGRFETNAERNWVVKIGGEYLKTGNGRLRRYLTESAALRAGYKAIGVSGAFTDSLSVRPFDEGWAIGYEEGYARGYAAALADRRA